MNLPDYDCRLGRRAFLSGTAGGFFSFALNYRGAQSLLASDRPLAKKLLVIWADGGPSQFETFDPKPGAATSGGTGAIPTASKDIQISEKLPYLAKQMDTLSVVRNITSNEGEHERARYFLHTGYPQVEAFPRPALGSVMSHRSLPGDLPRYIMIGENAGFGPAYLGMENGPFGIESAEATRKLLRALDARKDRIALTQKISRNFSQSHHAAHDSHSRVEVLSRIERLIDTDLYRALDIEKDPGRDKYGEGKFAGQALLARRLLETGVPFVEVVHGGWDTHQQNDRNTSRLCQSLDQPFAALLGDLKTSGLIDETIVMWLGEFGRTPQINATAGRDHFPTVVPVAIGGGGFAGGLAVGQTNHDGTAIDGEAYSVADLFATLLNRIGVAPDQEFPTQFGSMTTATDAGKVIGELG